MSGHICWEGLGDKLRSEGRNGIAIQTGLVVRVYDFTEPAKVNLAPVNSRGVETRGCSLEIPETSLEDLIQKLQAARTNLERTRHARVA